MKIAYICADPGIPILGNKGASVHVREFTEALIGLGHKVQIFGAAGGATEQGVNRTKAALTLLPPSERTRQAARLLAHGMARLDAPLEHPHLFSELLHVVANPEFVNTALPLVYSFGPDLIIARHALFSTAGLELARALNRPFILEVNAPLVEERRRYWDLVLESQAEQVESQVFAGADWIIAVSEGVRAYLERYHAPRERIVVLPNGVNLSHFRPEVDGQAVRRRYGLEGETVIGFAGSLKPWHGVDVLMRAFAGVYDVLRHRTHSETVPLKLLIIGDGPERARLEQLSREMGLTSTVTFTGAVPHSQIPEHLAAVDIAAAPYIASDGFYFSPLKVMEYMAMGRAIVAPRLGQLPSLLQNGTRAWGLLYPPDDQHELALALLRLVGDPALRQELGARAVDQARLRSSWEGIAQQIVNLVTPSPSRIETLQPAVPA